MAEKAPSWRDHLQTASFRGVAFKVLDTTTSVGRRNVLHQYPFADVPYVEDLGLDADKFTVVGYVVQNFSNAHDYFGERDGLLQALREAGAGTLVHPFLGEFLVSLVGQAEMTESFAEGGIARFTMHFVAAGYNEMPCNTVDHINAVNSAVEDLQKKEKSFFAKVLDTTGVSNFLNSEIVSDVKAGYSMMKSTLNSVKGLTSTIRGEAFGVIDTALGELSGLMGAAEDIYDNVTGTFGVFDDLIDGLENLAYGYGWAGDSANSGAVRRGSTGVSTVKAALSLVRFGELSTETNLSPHGGYLEPSVKTDSSGTVIATRAKQETNRNAVIEIFRTAAISSAIKVAVKAEFGSADEAISIMSDVIEALDDHLTFIGDTVGSDEMYSVLEGLRPKIVNAMISMGATLAPVEYYTVPLDSVPLLRLAYERYEDLDREVEMFDRNVPAVEHPGILPGGKALEFLTR